MKIRPLTVLAVLLLALAALRLAASEVAAAPAAAAAPLPTAAQVDELIGAGERWLLAQQRPDGSFVPGHQFALGITELAVQTLRAEPSSVAAGDPRLAKACTFIVGFRRKDGGFYDPAEGLGSYGTALGLMALQAAGAGDPALIAGARDYLLGIQDRDPHNVCRGGIGFGPEEGPGAEDLHNTSVALDALRAAGVPASDPRMQEILHFVERCQNRSPSVRAPGGIDELQKDERPWVTGDNGGVYSPTESKAGGDWKPAGPPPKEPPRLVPYGSMTYALLTSYIMLDLAPDDARVATAFAWLRANYSLTANPGMPPAQAQEGLYYYYQIMARTLHLLKATRLDLPGGRSTDWRADLFAAIAAQGEDAKPQDGKRVVFWINRTSRWGEGMPHLATAYLVQALKHLRASL